MPIEQSMSGDSLATRTVSGFPLSIGTALAMETLFAPRQNTYDPERPKPPQVEVAQYQECWINLTTMFRNMVGAISKEAFLATTEGEFKDTLLMEMEVIDSLFQNEGSGLCRPRYYWCTYESLYKKTSEHIKFREDKTDAQKTYQHRMMKSIELLVKQTEAVQKFDTEVKTNGQYDALMISHIPYDLLSSKNFRKLGLLESHSGKLKLKQDWYTKYYPVGDADLSHLPFLRRLLMVFGDRVLIQPSDIKLRKLIVEIAQKRGWTSHTSEAMVMQGFELDIKEPFVLQFLKAL